MARIGFIGLGIMGKPMARNLMRAGHSLTVHDVMPEPVAELVNEGAVRGKSSKETAELSEIVITMLPDGPQVESVLLGADGVLEGAPKGSIVVDMSSISPVVAQKAGAACDARGIEFLDAPVSGGESKAIDGTLAVMAGGKLEIFEKVLPVLQKMAASVVLTGPIGAGNVTKLANQIMVACNIAAMGEALVLATRAGLDPEIVVNAVAGGLAGSAVLKAKAPMVIARQFEPGFRIALHQKDLRNALLAAESLKVPLPFTSMAHQVLTALMNEGKGGQDHSAMVTFIEDMAGVRVRRPSAARELADAFSSNGKQREYAG